jgi:photosystem II stability/assembly factor-like uncharacterized protein
LVFKEEEMVMKAYIKISQFFVLIAVIVLAFASFSIAQEPGVWTNLGLYGGQIYDIAIDPSNPDKMFVGAYLGDGLFVTEDGGATWLPVETENEPEGEGTFKNHSVRSVKIAPSDNNVIWAVHNQWAEKSTDGGQTWTHILNSTMQRDCQNCGGDGDNWRFCEAVAIDPTRPNLVYVSTAGPNNSFLSGAVYKTADGGETWTKVNKGVDFDYPVVDIDVDPQNSNIIWAVTNSYGYGGWAGTLYRSEDGGGSWSTIFKIAGSFYDVEVKPNDSNSIFTANAYGIFRHYFDEGEWKTDWILNYRGDWPPPSDEVFARMVRTLAFDPQNPDVIYAAWKNPYGGDARPKVAKGSPPYGDADWEIYTLDYELLTLAVHPTNSEVIFGGDIYLGVYKSQDHGETWAPINNGINAVIVYDVAIDPKDTTHFLAGTLSGVYEKKGTVSWSQLLPYNTESLQFHPTDSQIFYAGLDLGYLAKTADGGLTWSYTYVGHEIRDIAIDPTHTDTVFIASRQRAGPGQILKSTDGGANFKAVLDGVNQSGEEYAFNVVIIDANDPEHVFAGGGNFYAPRVLGEVWESKNGGLDWSRTSLQDEVVNDILIDPQNPDIMYAGCGYSAGTDVPIYKSTDGGQTWAASYEGIPGGAWNVLLAVWGSSSTSVFAVGSDGHTSHYDGSSWSEMDSKTTQDLEGVWGSSNTDVFGVGSFGSIVHYDGNIWSAMSSGTSELLRDVWGNAQDSVYAVGNNGTILHYNGSTWSEMTSPSTETLWGVWGGSVTSVFAVGNSGTILHYNGNSWSAMNSGTSEGLEKVWGNSAADVYVVGDNGTILHYNGSSWSEMSSGTKEHLNDVWGSSSTDVFAVGHDGIILHYDGSTWSEMTTGISEENITSVWGSSGTDVFVVGDHGGIYHYGGSAWSVMKPAGKNWNCVTDLEFHRQNKSIIYASTFQAGVYLSPNQAGNWLNLGAPEYAVHAISTSSLYAATDAGVYECTGNGIIAGKVEDAVTGTGINQANVWSDFGVKTISVMGEYMMSHPTGIFDVSADAEKYFESTVSGVEVLGGDVTWANIPMQAFFRVIDILPHDKAGINDSTRVSSDTSFAVLLTAPDGIDITDANSIKFNIDDGVNDPYTRNLGHSSVRTIKVNPDEKDSNVTKLWAVYDRSKDAPYDNEYAFDSKVDMQVEATDKAGMQTSKRASFKIETQEEHDDELASLPDTEPVDPTDPALSGLHNAGTQVSSGALKGAKIIYNSSEPVLPRFGPLNELPAMDMEGSEGVGVPVNLQPHTVFETPVKIFIPCPGWSDVSSLNVYVFKEDNWALACDADGRMLPGGDGWMVPDSRVNHNNGSPSTIEVQVYRFSGAQAASSTSDISSDGSSGGGGGCFIDTAEDG